MTITQELPMTAHSTDSLMTAIVQDRYGSADVNQGDLRVLKGMLETGNLVPVVGRRYPLSEVPAAVRELAAGHSRGKSVITIC
jgi:NADPH:quinone reductase-like Zn-dependent oxidoreductase